MVGIQGRGHDKPVEGYAIFEREKGPRVEDNPWDRSDKLTYFGGEIPPAKDTAKYAKSPTTGGMAWKAHELDQDPQVDPSKAKISAAAELIQKTLAEVTDPKTRDALGAVLAILDVKDSGAASMRMEGSTGYYGGKVDNVIPQGLGQESATRRYVVAEAQVMDPGPSYMRMEGATGYHGGPASNFTQFNGTGCTISGTAHATKILSEAEAKAGAEQRRAGTFDNVVEGYGAMPFLLDSDGGQYTSTSAPDAYQQHLGFKPKDDPVGTPDPFEVMIHDATELLSRTGLEPTPLRQTRTYAGEECSDDLPEFAAWKKARDEGSYKMLDWTEEFIKSKGRTFDGTLIKP